MGRYAADTEVPVDRSRDEVERTLKRYGASEFLYGWNADKAMIQFAMRDRRVRFVLPLPPKDSQEFTSYLRGGMRYQRAEGEAAKRWEQACRQRWRALALVVKAKLEAVESEIASFEEEFLAHIMLPDGSTVGEWAVPQVAQAYELGRMPAMLPQLEGR
jgi:hypothetical protein